MDIDKAELQARFLKGDHNYLIHKAYDIAAFIVNNSQSGIFIKDRDFREDMIQECVSHFAINLKLGKINPKLNIFSFIWISSKRKILEHLRTQVRRRKIRNFESLDFQLEEFKVDSDKVPEYLIDNKEEKETSVTFEYEGRVYNVDKKHFKDKRTLRKHLKEIMV